MSHKLETFNLVLNLLQWGSEYQTFELRNHLNYGLLLLRYSNGLVFRYLVPSK